MNAPYNNETDLKGRIVKTLNAMFPDSEFWVVNAGGRTRRAKQSPSGTPDIIGYLAPRGLFIGIETKMPTKVLNDNQVKWHSKATAAGVWITVAYSVDQAVLFVQLARNS